MFTDKTLRRLFVLPACGALALGALAPAAGGFTRAHASGGPRNGASNYQCTKRPLGAATDYNVFILGDATQYNSDTQGRLAVGGNATLTNYSVGATLGSFVGDALVVGGNLTLNSVAVHYGNAAYGGTLTQSKVTFPEGGSFRQGSPLNFTKAGADLQSLSRDYASLQTNGTTTVQGGFITLTGTNARLNVFSVSGSAVSSANGLSINVPAGSTVLVNVDGSSDQIANAGFANLTGVSFDHVLFNFYQATSLTLSNTTVAGSILAPSAAINFQPSLTTGALIGASLYSGGQNNGGQNNGGQNNGGQNNGGQNNGGQNNGGQNNGGQNNGGQNNTTPFTGCLPKFQGLNQGGQG